MSEWKQEANRRRDQRHTAICIRPPGGSQKNTARWCRGKIGRAHRPVCVPYNEENGTSYAPPDWKILRCQVCGKHLENWLPGVWTKTAPPAWVTS